MNLALTPAATHFYEDSPVDAFKHAQQHSFTGEAYEEYNDDDCDLEGEVDHPAEEESGQSLQSSSKIHYKHQLWA